MKPRIYALALAVLLALGVLSGCGEAVPPSSPAPTEAPMEDKIAGADEMTTVEEVVEAGMVPIYGDQLRDGVYDVEMKSSSSMFKADHCQLIVENGQMRAVLYMTSKSYLYMYAGTAEEAAAADEADYIPLAAEDGDMGSFTLPVEALDAETVCASFSKKKEKWYERALLFRADSLPADAFLESPFTTLADLGLEDGAYTVEVTLGGGSGRASIDSPTTLTVSGDVCTATIVWGSANYDYMVVNETEYYPVNEEGNSVFEIPVSGFDRNMPVQADTTAMSQPHLIDYTLLFDSATITPVP